MSGILSNEEKRNIYDSWLNGVSQTQLAKDYGVSRSTIKRAIDWAQQQEAEYNREHTIDIIEDDNEIDIEIDDNYEDVDEIEFEIDDEDEDDALNPDLFNAVMTRDSISISHPNGETRTVSNDACIYDKVKEALMNGDMATAYKLARPAEAVKEWSDGILEVKDNKVFLHGEDIADKNMSLAKRIIDILGSDDADAQKEFAKLVKFVKRCYLNPSIKVMSRIYDFCKATDIEIDDEGNLLCWKKVNNDYTDVYTGTINNTPGQVVSMPRSHVDDDDKRTCSRGLHVCSQSYLSHYSGDRIVKVKVAPEDIISIPIDYNDAKMRTCRYEVLEDCTDMFK